MMARNLHIARVQGKRPKDTKWCGNRRKPEKEPSLRYLNSAAIGTRVPKRFPFLFPPRRFPGPNHAIDHMEVTSRELCPIPRPRRGFRLENTGKPGGRGTAFGRRGLGVVGPASSCALADRDSRASPGEGFLDSPRNQSARLFGDQPLPDLPEHRFRGTFFPFQEDLRSHSRGIPQRGNHGLRGSERESGLRKHLSLQGGDLRRRGGNFLVPRVRNSDVGNVEQVPGRLVFNGQEPDKDTWAT